MLNISRLKSKNYKDMIKGNNNDTTTTITTTTTTTTTNNNNFSVE